MRIVKTELEIIEEFYEEVCSLAEEKMCATGRLEGSHFAAMQEVLKNRQAKAGFAHKQYNKSLHPNAYRSQAR